MDKLGGIAIHRPVILLSYHQPAAPRAAGRRRGGAGAAAGAGAADAAECSEGPMGREQTHIPLCTGGLARAGGASTAPHAPSARYAEFGERDQLRITLRRTGTEGETRPDAASPMTTEGTPYRAEADVS